MAFFESSSRSEPTRSTGGRWTLLTPGDQQRSGCRRTASSSLQAWPSIVVLACVAIVATAALALIGWIALALLGY